MDAVAHGVLATGAAPPLYDAYRAALAGQALPLAALDLDALEENLRRLLARSGGLPIRMVTKSIRSVGVLRHLMARSKALQGLLCFSAREAAWLAGQGFDDLVVAYPTVEPADLAAVTAAITAGGHITLMVDHADQVTILAEHARQAGVVLPVAIDLDMSSDFPGLYFGVYRSPVRGAADAVALAAAIACRPNLKLDGLMGYESQIAGLQDAGGAPKTRVIRALKKRSVAETNARRTDTVAALRAAGHTLRFVNGGGTGSFETTRQDPSVTELAAGSGLFSPTLFDGYAAWQTVPAAFFAVAVTRKPRPGMVTCAGGGYVASGPAGPSRLPAPWLPAGCALVGNEGAGEVQTPLRLPPGLDLPLGAPVFFRHAKAGELCERFNELVALQGGAVTSHFPTYRGNGCCFF